MDYKTYFNDGKKTPTANSLTYTPNIQLSILITQNRKYSYFVIIDRLSGEMFCHTDYDPSSVFVEARPVKEP